MQCTSSDLLCYVNQYSNLILAVVTTAYVILTWRMVAEMRRARENESEPSLITTLIPFGPVNVKFRIQNVGLGPALHIEARIKLEPDSGDSPIWRQPALVSGAYEDFLLPDKSTGMLPEFRKVAEQYDKLIVDLKWSNIYGRKEHKRYEIDLKEQLQGWYSAHRLIQPADIPTQLAAIQEELKGIKEELEKPNRSRQQMETMQFVRMHYSKLARLQRWIRSWFE